MEKAVHIAFGTAGVNPENVPVVSIGAGAALYNVGHSLQGRIVRVGGRYLEHHYPVGSEYLRPAVDVIYVALLRVLEGGVVGNAQVVLHLLIDPGIGIRVLHIDQVGGHGLPETS